LTKDTHTDAITLSQQFWQTVRTENASSDRFLKSLKTFDEELLVKQLQTEAARKAFWINLYNAGVQWLLKRRPEYFQNRWKFFRKKRIVVARHILSLDDIEHGILRHSKIKWAMGYLDKLFPSQFEKECRVKRLDYRIHFTLNCGAKSCPPIAFYEPGSIENQLDTATQNFLQSEIEYDPVNNILHLPKLLQWYRADFGGKKGILKILRTYHLIPSDKKPKLKFKSYNWTLKLKNYTS
jgi:hypothetical protein